MRHVPRALALLVLGLSSASRAAAVAVPQRAPHGMVATESVLASKVGADVLREGGSAVDAAVATAFALAVVHPTAGNIGGGGFLLFRSASGEAVAYDFRELAPARATATMFLVDGRYDTDRHHNSHVAVGVPGTVAGLHLAWSENGKLPWRRLLEPAIALARDGFVVSEGLARDLRDPDVLAQMRRYPATQAQFWRNGKPYEASETLRQNDLARTLERIAAAGPAGFYEGATARLIVEEMRRGGGLITATDLEAYRPRKRTPLRGSYRGYELLSMPPPSSGGTALFEMLNVLEGYELRRSGFASAQSVHWMAEAMRRAFADRARHLADPDLVPEIPVSRLISKEYANELRAGIRDDRASTSSIPLVGWSADPSDTTHLSVVDAQRNAVALTYTLEDDYGSKIVVPGGGFLLNNEMGDFNAGPGLTDATGLIGTAPNLAAPGKRMLSSMSPTIITKDGGLLLVLGAAGGRRIINTVLEVIVNLLDFDMNVQEAVDAPRFHHQWQPDVLNVERLGLSPDTLALLRARGHAIKEGWPYPSLLQAIRVASDGSLEAGIDRRGPDGGAAGY